MGYLLGRRPGAGHPLEAYDGGPAFLNGLGAALGEGADDERKGDRRLDVHRHHRGVGGYLAPGLRFLEGAAGEAAPLRLGPRDLDGVLVAGELALEDVAGDLRLLDEVLGGAAADVDDAGGGGGGGAVRRLQNAADDVGKA